MKNLLFLLFALSSCCSLIGQDPLTVETDQVTILNGAKLGVGVSVPMESIDISGGLRLGNTAGSNSGTLRWSGSKFEGYDGSSWLDLASISPFERNGTVIRTIGNYTTDDFVFGRDELPQAGQNFQENLFFFDKEKGAFRAGRIQFTQNWAPDSIGTRSVAFGYNTLAKGLNSIAIGSNTKALGTASIAMGSASEATGTGSFATGFSTEAKGNYSFASGYIVEAPSYAEVAMGRFNTIYTPDNATNWDTDDRLFVIGNGTTTNVRNDAFSLWKNGQLGLGASNPEARLHIESDDGESGLNVSVDGDVELFVSENGNVIVGGDVTGFNSKLLVDADSGEDIFRVRTAGTTKFKINENGGIRNSNATATFALQLQNSSTDLLGRGQAFSWNTYSDQRIKSNLQKINYGLAEILQLKALSYDHHDSDYFEDGRVIFKSEKISKDIGLLAQETYKIIPEAVSRPEDETKSLWSMDYTRLVPVLISGMQEQQAQIEDMKTMIDIQQAQIEALTKLVEQNE